METRSLYAIMRSLSQHFDPPAEHISEGQASVSSGWLEDEGEMSPWIDIRYSRLPELDAFVQVYYNGYWYYIAKDDRNSKQTFALVIYLFSLQATTKEGGLPVVTVQAGG
jgi:hypothetical protein